MEHSGVTSKLILGFLNGTDTLRFSNHSQLCDALLLSVGKRVLLASVLTAVFSAARSPSVHPRVSSRRHSLLYLTFEWRRISCFRFGSVPRSNAGVKQFFFVDLDPLLKVDHPYVRTVHVRLCTRASLPRTRQRHLGRRRHHRNTCQNVGSAAPPAHGPSLCEVLSASILHPLHV